MRLQSHLRPWLPDPDRFEPLLTLLRDTGIIIGGSFVVRYLLEDEETWIPRSLDFLCSASSERARKALRTFLENAGGVTEEPVLGRPSGIRDCGVVGEVAYTMWSGERCLHRVVRVFLTSGDDPRSVVPWTWTTLFSNYITASSVVVAYPRTTFRRIGLCPYPHAETLPAAHVLIRTARRGFFTSAMGLHPETHTEALPPSYYSTALRSFGDTSSFSMRWASRPSTPRLRDMHGRYVCIYGPLTVAWQYGMLFLALNSVHDYVVHSARKLTNLCRSSGRAISVPLRSRYKYSLHDFV